MAASCQNNLVEAPVARVVRQRVFVFLAGFSLLAALPLISAHAATGDGRVVYGENATGVLRTRTRTNATGAWSAEGNGTTTATAVTFVVTKASPQADEFITASKNNTNLYVSRYNGSWTLDIDQAGIVDSTTMRGFDLAYEQNTGNALVAYSNGATSNELSYYYYVATSSSWIGPCTLELTGIGAAIEWVRMESRPSSDEIALAVTDTADQVTAAVWYPPTIDNPFAGDPSPANCTTIGSYWTDQGGDLTGANAASGTNAYKVDVAYEQSSGDILVAWYRSSNTTLDYATNPGSGAGWSAGSDAAATNNAAEIDLCSEPSSNRIGLASGTSNGTSADVEGAIWDGTSAWTGWGDRDASATGAATVLGVGCGWVGTTGELVLVYNDSATTGDLDWHSWTSGGGWVAETDQSYSASTEKESDLAVYNYPGENKISVLLATSATSTYSDLWAMRYDGANWTVEDGDTGTGGNQALELALSATTAGAGGLALTAFSPTPVAEVLDMVAQKMGDATQLMWNTKSESRIDRFEVVRAEKPADPTVPQVFERISDMGVPSQGGPVSGGHYSWMDMKAEKDKEYEYKVEIVGRGGKQVTQTVGPIAPDPGGRVTYFDVGTGAVTTTDVNHPLTAASRFTRTGETVTLTETEEGEVVQATLPRAKAKAPEQAAEKAAENIAEKAAAIDLIGRPALRAALHPRVKLLVHAPGVYRVTGQELADAGVELTLLKPKQLALHAAAKRVPMRLVGMEDGVMEAEDAVEFIGEPATTRYYRAQAYWLSFHGAGDARIKERLARQEPGFEVAAYPHRVRLEGDEAYYSESPTDAHWLFDYEIYAGDAQDITLDIDHLVHLGETAQLTVALQGLSTWGYADSAHNRQHALIYVNDELVGEHAWQGDTYAELQLDVPLALLQDGANTLKVEATDEDGTLEQFFMVDRVQLIYPRALVAGEGGLAFAEPSQSGRVVYTVEAFPAADALVYRLGRRGGVTLMTAPQVEGVDDHYTVTFSDYAGNAQRNELADEEGDGEEADGVRYLVVPPAAIKAVDEVVLKTPLDLEALKLKPYVVVAPTLFHEALADFVAHRRASLVAVEDLYDLYTHGLPDPAALKHFLLRAADQGVTMALLVGDGHFDYRNFQGHDVPEYVPAALVPNRYGETVSDAWFATPEGTLVPKLAIGRWPVRSVEDVQAVVAKTLAYEGQGSANGAVFLADDEPVFRATLDQLAQAMPYPEEVVRINYGEYDALGAKAKLLEEINNGTGLVAYDGHGGVQLWSSAQLLINGDVEAMTNDHQYPVLLALGCLSGYFGYPADMDSLAETLLRADAKGIVAAVSPSGLTSSVEQQTFATALLRALVNDHQPLGTALLKAYAAVEAQVPASKAQAVIETFNLLGDPALILHAQ